MDSGAEKGDRTVSSGIRRRSKQPNHRERESRFEGFACLLDLVYKHKYFEFNRSPIIRAL